MGLGRLPKIEKPAISRLKKQHGLALFRGSPAVDATAMKFFPVSIAMLAGAH
jgi:hypothetical protein